jgi:hypothetical protein
VWCSPRQELVGGGAEGHRRRRRAAGTVGVRGERCCRGSPGFWSPQAGSTPSWAARKMVSAAGGTPAVENCGGGPILTHGNVRSNPACPRTEAEPSGLGDDPMLETVPLQWLLAVMTPRSSRSTAMQDTPHGGASGRSARDSTAPWG